jgi:formate hydrogenlyase subunit 3/multisubunit Na+/H+ antiporter MnhD subunit
MNVVVLAIVALGVGAAIRLLRRLPRVVFIATLVGAGLLLGILAFVPATPLPILGRTLELDDAARLGATAWIALTAAFAFFAPLAFERGNEPATAIANSQGAYFFGALGLFVVVLGLDSFPLAVFFWAIGLIVLMLAAQPNQNRVGGAAQFLLITVIAGASLLLAHRFIELYPLTLENLDLARSAVVFLALGLGLLLAIFPFSIWLGPLADEMPLLGMAFLVGVAQPLGVWLLLQEMGQVNWLVDKSPLMTILWWGGVLTAIVGVLLALAEQRTSRLIVFLALVPLGIALVGLALGTRLALVGAMALMLNRALGVALLTGGSIFVRHHLEQRWQFVGAGAVLAGGWTLAGLPPTLGFAGQSFIYQGLPNADPNLLIVMLVCNGAVLLVGLRAAWQLIVAGERANKTSDEIKIVPYLCGVVVIVLLIVIVVAGMFPQSIAEPLAETIGRAVYLK